jgi:hypothetical protein
VNVPVAIVLVTGVLLTIRPAASGPDRPRLDLAGAALLTGAVMAVIVGASLVENPAGLLLAGAGLAAGFLFVVHQRRAGSPLVPRAAFASVPLRTGTWVSFVNTATTTSTGVLATLLLQEERGVSAVRAGLTLVPFSLAVIVGSALSKPLGARLRPNRLAAAGLAGIAMGNLLLAVTEGAGVAAIVTGVSLAGTGLGVASVAATAIGTDVPESLSGTASGVLNTGAQLGSAIGVAALLLLASAVGRPGAGTAVAWAATAGIALTAGLVLTVRGGVRAEQAH